MDVIHNFLTSHDLEDPLLDKYSPEQINEINNILQNSVKESYDDGVLCNYAGLYTSINNNREKAKKYYELAAQKGDPNALYNLSKIHTDDKNYTEAQKYLELGKQTGYNLYKCHNSLANTYYWTEKYDLAIENYKKALEYPASDKYVCYNNLGNVYHDIKEYASAIENYKKALELNPKDIYYNRLGNTYYAMQENQLAIDNYIKAIELSKDDYVYYGNLANTYTEIGQYELAISNYIKALELADDESKCYYYNKLANNYHSTRQYNLAADNYIKALETGKGATEIYLHNLANTYYQMDKHELATEYYVKALEAGYDAKISLTDLSKLPPLRLYHILINLKNKPEVITNKIKTLQDDYTVHCFENKKRLLSKQDTCPICYEDKTIIPRECAHHYCLDCYVRLEKCGICLK